MLYKDFHNEKFTKITIETPTINDLYNKEKLFYTYLSKEEYASYLKYSSLMKACSQSSYFILSVRQGDCHANLQDLLTEIIFYVKTCRRVFGDFSAVVAPGNDLEFHLVIGSRIDARGPYPLDVEVKRLARFKTVVKLQNIRGG